MEIRDVVALNLRHLRRAKGLSQEDLADKAGVDRTYVSALERGVYAVTVDVMAKLAEALEVDEAEIVRRPQGRRQKR